MWSIEDLEGFEYVFLPVFPYCWVLGNIPDLQPGCQPVPSPPLPGLYLDYLSCPCLLLSVLASSNMYIFIYASVYIHQIGFTTANRP